MIMSSSSITSQVAFLPGFLSINPLGSCDLGKLVAGMVHNTGEDCNGTRKSERDFFGTIFYTCSDTFVRSQTFPVKYSEFYVEMYRVDIYCWSSLKRAKLIPSSILCMVPLVGFPLRHLLNPLVIQPSSKPTTPMQLRLC